MSITGVEADNPQSGVSEKTFRAWFVLGPCLFCSVVPTLIFGVTIGEWGSNLIWGSMFGLGWCLSAFWSGNLVHDEFSTRVGLAWGWAMLVPLWFGSGWLWRKLMPKRRRSALKLLLLTLLLNLPARVMLRIDAYGVHLPDYTTHLNESY